MDLTNTGIYNGDTYLARPIELHRGMAARKYISNTVQFRTRCNVVEAYDRMTKV